MMPLHEQTVLETFKILLLEYGIQAIELDLTEDRLELGDHRFLSDALVGALQEAGRLQDALLCAKHGVSTRGSPAQGTTKVELDQTKAPNAAAIRAVQDRKEDLIAFANEQVLRGIGAMATIYKRATQALEVTRTHRIRGHRIGSYYVEVAATTRRELGAWLFDIPREQRAQQLEALAQSPFRHLRVTVMIEHWLPDGRYRRELVHTEEALVAPDRPLPGSALLRNAREHLRATPRD